MADEKNVATALENDAFVVAWHRFVEKTSSAEVEETFIRLLQRVFPNLDDEHKEKIAYTAVIPFLAKWCRDQDQHLKTTRDPLPTRQLQLFSLLIDLCETGVKTVVGYHRAVEELLDYADLLFHHGDTRTPFLRFAKRMAVVEWNVLGAEGRSIGSKNNADFVFNRFLFNKYYVIGKLIMNDTQNFVSDTAREFWLTSAVLLDTCRDLLANPHPANNFRLVFTDFGGFTHANRILEAAAQSLRFGGGSRVGLDEKSAHRLIELLCDTVSLCLASGASNEKVRICWLGGCGCQGQSRILLFRWQASSRYYNRYSIDCRPVVSIHRSYPSS